MIIVSLRCNLIMSPNVSRASNGRQNQDSNLPYIDDNKLTGESLTPSRLADISAASSHRRQEQYCGGNSASYMMRRWLDESPREGPWSGTTAQANSHRFKSEDKGSMGHEGELLHESYKGYSRLPSNRRSRLICYAGQEQKKK